MSDSRRKTKAIKICGTSGSDKKDRQRANKAFRRLSKVRVQQAVMEDVDEISIPVDMDEVSNVYSFTSDGCAYYREDLDEKYMRK